MGPESERRYNWLYQTRAEKEKCKTTNTVEKDHRSFLNSGKTRRKIGGTVPGKDEGVEGSRRGVRLRKGSGKKNSTKV